MPEHRVLFSFPARFKVPVQHPCAGDKWAKRSKPTPWLGVPGSVPAPEGLGKAGRRCRQRGERGREGDVLPGPCRNGESLGDNSVWAQV